MVKREHLWLRRELLSSLLALFLVYPSERSEARLMACFSANDGQGAAFSLIEGYRRTGNRHVADAIPCMLAKIEGDVVQRALELAGVQVIDADDSGGEGVRLRRHQAINKNGAACWVQGHGAIASLGFPDRRQLNLEHLLKYSHAAGGVPYTVLTIDPVTVLTDEQTTQKRKPDAAEGQDEEK